MFKSKQKTFSKLCQLSIFALLSMATTKTITWAQNPNEPPYTDAEQEWQEKPSYQTPANLLEKPKKVDDEGRYHYSTDEIKAQKDVSEHPQKDSGLEYIDKEGRYFYNVKKEKQDPSESFGKPIEIRSDGKYVYDIDKGSASNKAFSFRAGAYDYLSLKQEINGEEVNFKDVYKNDRIAILLDYEKLISSKYGYTSWKFSTGILYAYASNGRFANQYDDDTKPQESFRALSVPLIASYEYKFQYKDEQFFIPYINAGAGMIGYAELRDDDKTIAAYNFSLQGGAGFNLQLDYFLAFRNLITDSNAQHVYLSFDARYAQAMQNDPNLSLAVATLGFIYQY